MNIKCKLHNLHKELNPIKAILNARGVQKVNDYINPKINNVESWKTLNNIDKGIQILNQHLHNNSNILIVVDSDADGYTSAALTKQMVDVISDYLNLKPNIEFYIHSKKVHGLTDECMNHILNLDYNLVILPDAGTNDYEQCDILKKINVDTLVLDHHPMNNNSDSNIQAVVINNQISPTLDKEMTGVGIVYKFFQAYLEYLNITDIQIEQHLDLVAVGMVADSCPLMNLQSRYYVMEGLRQINEDESTNRFIKHIVIKSQSNKVSVIDISFIVAPIINSIIRQGSMDDKELLFRAMCNETYANDAGEQLHEIVYKIATSTRRKQQEITKEAAEFLSTQIKDCGLDTQNILVVNGDNSIDKAFTGLIANKVASTYKKPTILLNQSYDDIYTGSARSISDHPLTNLNKWCKDTGLFEMVEGHDSAFGVKIKKNNINKLYDVIDTIDMSMFDNIELEVESVIQEDELSIQLIKSIGKYKHIWGVGQIEPIFYITGLKIPNSSISLSGKNRNVLKIQYRGIEIIKFQFDETEYENMIKTGDFLELNIIGKFAINEYLGNSTAQITIEELEYVKTDAFVSKVNPFG